jgi:cytidylate kinase
MDGRDIGTNVLKDATVKIYLTASVEERAKRRYNELIIKNPNVSINYDEIKAEIIKRDHLDTTRKLNPLVKAHDAIEVDTSLLTIDEVVDTIIGIILGKVNSNGTNI